MLPLTFRTKDGRQATIRPLKKTDVEELLGYANALSAEDTFVQLSGEHISLEEEKRFITKRLASIDKGASISLVVTVGDVLAGMGGVDRGERRKRHVGQLHISIAKAFRGVGVGETLLRTLIAESERVLGIRLVTLTCFAMNTTAIRLYQKVGFQKSGEIPGAYAFKGSYASEVTMYLPL